MDFTSFMDTLPVGYTASYQWDFGDNSGTSTDANPSYTYASPGEYDVCLDITLDDGGGPPVCSGDEFVYPADPDVRAGWINYVIDVKQYPIGVPNPAGANSLVINCPEASWETVIGEFIENDLASLTPAEIVQELVEYVNVAQPSPDWNAVDLSNGFYLLQIHLDYNGFHYTQGCGGVCATGTTGDGINLYWVYDSGPTGTPDLQDNNYLAFADNWDCTQTAGDTICLGEEVPGPGGNSCVISICNNVEVPCVPGARQIPFSSACQVDEFIYDQNNVLVPNTCVGPDAEDLTQGDINLRALIGSNFEFKLKMDIPCCPDPSGMNLAITGVIYGPGATLTYNAGGNYYSIEPTGSPGGIRIFSPDFGTNNVLIDAGNTWVSPLWLSQILTIVRDASDLFLITEDLRITFELSGGCLAAPEEYNLIIRRI